MSTPAPETPSTTSTLDPQPPDCARERLDAYAATVTCVYCGVGPGLVRAEWRPKMVLRPLGSHSLAGAQIKASARMLAWPWLICGNCGHESEGKS